MEENYKKQINDMEEQIKILQGQIKDLSKYEKMKNDSDEAAIQMAILRDSLLDKGFTEDQVFQFMLAGIGFNRK